MVQFFKRLFRRKKAQTQLPMLIFNEQLITERMDQGARQLYELKGELSYQILLALISDAQNLKLLRMGGIKDANALHFAQGQLQALADIQTYVQNKFRNIHDQEQKKSKTEGAKKVVNVNRIRKANNQAGLAL